VKGAVGDWAIAPAAGVKTPTIENDAPPAADALLAILTYDNAVNGAIAHELNHVIGWDEPHDFHLLAAPTDYERQVSLAGPFLTQTPSDVVKPTVARTSESTGELQGQELAGLCADHCDLEVDNQHMGAAQQPQCRNDRGGYQQPHSSGGRR
jgi:hypothetical protein